MMPMFIFEAKQVQSILLQQTQHIMKTFKFNMSCSQACSLAEQVEQLFSCCRFHCAYQQHQRFLADRTTFMLLEALQAPLVTQVTTCSNHDLSLLPSFIRRSHVTVHLLATH